MQRDMIRSDPGIMMGKPMIAGTRITVELILEKLAAGGSTEQIIGEHPNLNLNLNSNLTEENVCSVLAFLQ